MIRWLGTDDLAHWRDIRSEALRLYPSAFLTSLEEFQALSDDKVRAQLAQGKVLAVFEDDQIIGTAAYMRRGRPQTKHRAEIGAVYMREAARGTGKAVELMDYIAAHALGEGVTQLELQVEVDNAPAIRFYEKLGFKRYGTFPGVVLTECGLADDYFYVKQLQN